MLSLKNIKKSYTTGEFTQHALKGISLEFRKNEFVAVLGASGSGKTTLLNIIGGLDRYDSGNLTINNKSTKNFKDRDWDAYRNNCIGFVFQSYNLINHINILDNVELSMTLSGVGTKERKERALEALARVGLKEHAHKKPNQLSGGQMQRVAIARALVNDPDIILADEPTGALDSETSVQIMNLIQEIAKDKLVIMVTHNPELANQYATRVVELKDGELISDTNPVTKKDVNKENFNIKKTAMSFLTALKLSFNNIKTKKGRTLLTAFASSIGIIGIALILSLSNGFQIQIDDFEAKTLSSMPIMITEKSIQLDEETMLKMHQEMVSTAKDYPTEKEIYSLPSMTDEMLHTNVITQDYIDYIEKLEPKIVSGLSYTRATTLNMITKGNNTYQTIDATKFGFAVLPKKLDPNVNGVMEENYDILEGHIPTKKEELLLVVDSKNRVDSKILEALGFDSEQEEITFSDLFEKEFKVVLNEEYYQALGDYFILNQDYESLYHSENAVTLKITGIIRGKEDKKIVTDSTGIFYTEELVDYVVSKNKDSNIVKVQTEKDYNVLTGQKFASTDNTNSGNDMTKEMMLSYLGADSVPVMINIYPKNFESKDQILEYLDKYNTDKKIEEQIIYTDMAAMISSLSSNIMDAITIVLIAFSTISLVVSCIMIGIITYISVLERTKEIGVLRALGARKKDIKRVFNAETFIIGVVSGLLGVFIAWLLTFPANIIIENLTELPNVARLNPLHAIGLVVVSVILTIISGSIPAHVASKKDPVEALRTE